MWWSVWYYKFCALVSTKFYHKYFRPADDEKVIINNLQYQGMLFAKECIRKVSSTVVATSNSNHCYYSRATRPLDRAMLTERSVSYLAYAYVQSISSLIRIGGYSLRELRI